MHTKSKEQNYCNNIFEDNKTCFEIAKEERARKNEKVQRLFNRYKESMPKYIEQYKFGVIDGEELMEWLECMKVRK